MRLMFNRANLRPGRKTLSRVRLPNELIELKCNDTAGAVVVDSSPNGNDAGIVGMPDFEQSGINANSKSILCGSQDGVLVFTIDSSLIDEDLTDFRIPIIPTSAAFYADINENAKRKKVYFTDSQGTKLYTEIQADYDLTGDFVCYWVCVNNISSQSDTKIYCVYDGSGDDQTAFTDDTNTTAAEASFDSHYGYELQLATSPGVGILDSTGNGFAGVSNATINVLNHVDAKIGKGYMLDGVDEYFKVPTTGLFTGVNDEISVEMLVKASAFAEKRIMEWGDEQAGVSFQTNNFGANAALYMLYTNGGDQVFSATETLNTTEWMHLVVTAVEGGGVGTGLYSYFNGAPGYSTGPCDQFRTNIDGYDNVVGCGRSLNASQFFNGIVDMMAVHTKSRSAAFWKARHAALMNTLLTEAEAGGYIDYSSNSAVTSGINSASTLTVTLALKPAEAWGVGASEQVIIDMHNDTNGLLLTYEAGDLRLKIDAVTKTYTVDLEADWSVLALRYDAGVVDIFGINGQSEPVLLTQLTGFAQSLTSVNDGYINPSAYVSDFRIYRKALSDKEISEAIKEIVRD